jgi:hypothetical protein
MLGRGFWPSLAFLGLAACAQQPILPPEQIVMPARTLIAEDWSRSFVEVYPGLRACLAATPSGPGIATGVAPAENNLMTVYTISTTKAAYQCLVSPSGGPPVSVKPYPGEAPSIGPIFTPPEFKPPTGYCLDTVPVRDIASLLVGWLSYRSC